MSSMHWHVTSGARSVEEEHEHWHETREPCEVCGARSWTKGGHHVTSSGLPLSPCYGASYWCELPALEEGE